MRRLSPLLALLATLVSIPATAAPPSEWNPVLSQAWRSGVYVVPPSLTKTPGAPAFISVRVENRNPFPVAISELAVRPTAARTVYGGEPFVVPAGKVRDVELSILAGERRKHRVHFRLALSRGDLSALSPLKRARAMSRARAVLSRELVFAQSAGDADWVTSLMAERVENDRELTALVQRLCQQERAAWATPPTSPVAALEHHAMFRREAQVQPELLGCLTADLDATIAIAALRNRMPHLAGWVAVRHDEGAGTRAPFKAILADAVRDALGEQIKEARRPWSMPSSRLHQWLEAVSLLEQLRVYRPDDSYDHPAHPDNPVQSLADLTEEFALDGRFEEADEGLEVLGRQSVAGFFPPAKLAELRALTEYERGVHLYDIARGVIGARARAHTAFDLAASHYPVRARAWKVALVLADHQFILVFGLFGLALLIFFGRKTDAWSRWLARARMAAARRMARGSHHGVDFVWEAVTRAGTLRRSRLNDRFRARLGNEILTRWATEDARLAAEAGQLVAGASSGRWRSPQATLEAALRDGHVDAAAVARARAVWRQDPVVDVLAALEAADLDALERALEIAAPPVQLVHAARTLGGVRLAETAPAENPAEHWRAAARALAGADLRTCDARTLRAAAFSAAACGETGRAVLAMEHLETGDPLRRTVALTAAREARLPAPADRARVVCELQRLAEVLDTWGDSDALDAQLRVAVLVRLAGGEDQTDERAAALLAAAGEHRGRAATVALACALDLLTDGDHGFDDEARRTLGTRWALLQALDAFGQGDLPAAAAVLAGADPSASDTADGTAVRLECARAVTAVAMGRVEAAVDSLGRALGRASRDLTVVQTVCAELAPALLHAPNLGPDLTAQIAAGCLAARDRGRVPWTILAERLVAFRLDDLAEAVLRHSDGVDRNLERVQELWQQLAAHAVRRGDCRRARACVILARGASGVQASTPITTG